MTSLKFFVCILLASLLTACDAPKLPSPFQGSDVTGTHPQADFQLTDFNGKPRRLADFRGKVVVLFFGYTHCPDVCPTTLADLAQMMRLLGAQASQVQVLFVTLDPERDNADLLKQYVPSFEASFLGLWGNANATAQAAKSFGVSYQKVPTKTSYTLDHTDAIYLLDTAGKLRVQEPYTQSADKIAADIHLLLALREK